MINRKCRAPSGKINTPNPSTRSNGTPPTLTPIQRPATTASNLSSRSHLKARDMSQLPQSPIKKSARKVPALSGRSDIITSRSSGRIDTPLSDIPTEEILLRMQEKHAESKRQAVKKEVLSLGKYNAYSRPRSSLEVPLRSVLMDPSVNNIPPSKTRSEMLRKRRENCVPHASFDIDGDGWVSQEDYRLAKRFDFDGNGVIDPQEMKVAKRVIAEEFFKRHKDNVHVFGKEIANSTYEENVKRLENAHNFERTLNLLKGVESSLRGRSSKEMLHCMGYSDAPVEIAKTDILGIDRNHSGSRQQLLETRKLFNRHECSRILERVAEKSPAVNTKRLALITNMAFEN
mmetsp:Transcript_12890/g.19381  ORF Transcript_12890/g.19381 Transcript_12890/m.19381 type:complete len:345 (+) Transcript_12890:113-1147(+)|eukprot:CAMPEP_0185028154 /NCGR_PEP_ID=MMETSP1103-20130426/13737_1 /TAXON_ID=36769 /ORGANISM="Paraphysomonas bandaiensis, Strain Caron Lab Isolate" /LENGTH=344 /DNA_ID=CAMNT_0027562473 /DNA_START=27 /DNA_END=1061 /DNA_ORIENTATION=-